MYVFELYTLIFMFNWLMMYLKTYYSKNLHVVLVNHLVLVTPKPPCVTSKTSGSKPPCEIGTSSCYSNTGKSAY